MSTTVKINGQRLDLDANPDLLLELLIGVTNLEEKLNSIDKRLYNVEKKDDGKSSNSQYFIKKKAD